MDWSAAMPSDAPQHDYFERSYVADKSEDLGYTAIKPSWSGELSIPKRAHA